MCSMSVVMRGGKGISLMDAYVDAQARRMHVAILELPRWISLLSHPEFKTTANK